MSWDDVYFQIKGKKTREDSIDLRNEYIEGVLGDIEGNAVQQHQFHKEIQGALYNWKEKGIRNGIISAPYGGGKSQQVPIALSSYLATLSPEKPHIIISADPMLSRNRIESIRQIFESDQYRYWCKFNGFEPAKYSKKDTDSLEMIKLKSNNRTGVPTFFASGIETKGTGWRCYYLWGDDICNNDDFKSKATRESRHKAWTNTWSKRVLDGGFEYLIRTPYHIDDANERLIKTGIYAHLEIAVKDDKQGYRLKEWNPLEGNLELVRQDEFELWTMNHSKEKLEMEEARDFAAYELGFKMLKESQDPKKSAYKRFSKEIYPKGNVMDVEFDWHSKKPLVMTCDFNRSPQAWALGQEQKIGTQNVFTFLEEIWTEDALTEEQAIKACKIILGMGHNFVELYGDGTSNQGGRKYGRSGESDWNTLTRILTEYGIRYRKNVKKSNPLRMERVKIVNNAICSTVQGVEVRKILVNPKCEKIIDDYLFSVVDDNGVKKREQGSRGHISDACDYWIYYVEKTGRFSILLK